MKANHMEPKKKPPKKPKPKPKPKPEPKTMVAIKDKGKTGHKKKPTKKRK